MMWRPMNLAERLKATNNRPSGFDYLRIALAVAVAIVHCRYTTYGFGLTGFNGNALIAGNALTVRLFALLHRRFSRRFPR